MIKIIEIIIIGERTNITNEKTTANTIKIVRVLFGALGLGCESFFVFRLLRCLQKKPFRRFGENAHYLQKKLRCKQKKSMKVVH